MAPGNGSVDVQAADFSSLTDGWIVATDRSGRLHLWATADGGRSWKPVGVIPGGPAWSPVSVRAISIKIGWLGLGQTLLATEDRGQTWTEISLPTGVVVASLEVVNANLGWLVSTDGRLAQTHDGGKSWVPSAGQLATP